MLEMIEKILTVLTLGPSDLSIRAMLDINPLLAALDRTPTMYLTPPIRRGGLHTILHPTNVQPTILGLTAPPHITSFGLARMIYAENPAGNLAPMAAGLETNMLAAKLVVPLGALLVALVRRRAVVRAAPPGRDHVVARMAAARASGSGTHAVQLAKVRVGVPGAVGDLGSAAGREARVTLTVKGARVGLPGLVAGGIAAAVGHAVWVTWVGAPRCAGGEGTAV